MKTFQIWDFPKQSSIDHSEDLVLWNSYSDQPNITSIPRIVDENEHVLKEKFLSLLYEISGLTNNKISLFDSLKSKNLMNFWWITNLSEKCNFSKSPDMDNIVKMLAFEIYFEQHSCETLELHSDNKYLVLAFKGWCKDRQIVFKHISKKKLPRLKLHAPHQLRAIVWLSRYLFQRKALFGINLTEWRNSTRKISFFSYLCNLDQNHFISGIHKSSFWGNLTKNLTDLNIQTNWLHIYVENELIPDPALAAKTIQDFSNNNPNELHVTLDTFTNFKLVVTIIRDWIGFQAIGIKYFSIFKNANPYYKLLIQDWKKTFFGVDGIKSLLMHHQFIESQRIIPKQNLGLYLQEYQTWESSLLFSWKKYLHKNIIGLPHSTVRFWDLRYFNDPRCFNSDPENNMPTPDKILLNGPLQKKIYDKGLLPGVDLIEAEALRFMHLNNQLIKPKKKTFNDDALKILLLGDYLPENTIELVNMIKECSMELSTNLEIIFKSHPVSSIPDNLFEDLSISFSTDSVDELLPLCDVAIASNVTTAALDAHLKRIPVICIYNPCKLNLSPLKEINSNLFASSSSELKEKIISVQENVNFQFTRPDEAFNLDPSLSMWLNLIKKYL